MCTDYYYYFFNTGARVLALILDFLILDLGFLDLGFSNFRLLTSNVI
jgi:hypothetical protein